MQVKEVIKQYGEDKRYIVRDEYEGVYWDREGEGSWYDYADGWIDNLDDEKALEVKADAYPEEGIILIIVDTSLNQARILQQWGRLLQKFLFFSKRY